MANSLSGLVGLTVGLPCSQVGTLFASVALVRIPNSYPGGFSATERRNHPSIPFAAGRSVPEAGAISQSASFCPSEARPHATRPSPGRVRPVWNSAVSRSGERGASRHEAGLGELPERDEQLAGVSRARILSSAPRKNRKNQYHYDKTLYRPAQHHRAHVFAASRTGAV